MITARSLIFYLLILLPSTVLSQKVRIRVYSDINSGSALITVVKGSYEFTAFNGGSFVADEGDMVIITYYVGRIAVKAKDSAGFFCDSVAIKGVTGKDLFSLRVMGNNSQKRIFTGDLECSADLGNLLFINVCNIEDYVAGVVMSEGGTGKNEEYFKTQAVIARTYTYKYYDRHIIDRYNLCDNIHCQAYMGHCSDTLINLATQHTRGLVILAKDSTLVIAAFHSNCGGETTPAEHVWLSGQPYLKRVVDPYCTGSRNARWRKSFSISEWTGYLKKSGFSVSADPSRLTFSQVTRVPDYHIGEFSIPFRMIRNDLGLRSSFFSVTIDGDSVILHGRGYGHGVGLCQEGAMGMASKGFDFRKIIGFYYSGIIITDIKNAVYVKNE
jgi:stage II sporulation protein D